MRVYGAARRREDGTYEYVKDRHRHLRLFAGPGWALSAVTQLHATPRPLEYRLGPPTKLVDGRRVRWVLVRGGDHKVGFVYEVRVEGAYDGDP